MNKKTISFYTLGCRLNQSETAVIKRTFLAGGYKIVDENIPSDIAVINTCTVTAQGDADARRLVNKINRVNPNSCIAMIGCQAQVQKEKLTGLPNVRWIVGNAEKMNLVSIVKKFQTGLAPKVVVPEIPEGSFILPATGIYERHTRANIKIQDGCNFFCSFCEIPYARGRARSRKFDDILKEAGMLASGGHQELVITGINIGTYKDSGNTIIDVISALEQIKGLKRIRISSIEPSTVSIKLLKKMEGDTKLCRHLHIPLQSGSDDILKLMNRKNTFRKFSDFVKMAGEKIPQICIGTDIIVGFPGETEKYFRETEERLKELPVHYFHVFSYSRRNIAVSRNLTGAIPSQIIRQRSKILRELGQKKRHAFYNTLIGTTQKILFEQKKRKYWAGLSDNYVRVEMLSNKNLSNRIIFVQLKNTGTAVVRATAGHMSRTGTACRAHTI